MKRQAFLKELQITSLVGDGQCKNVCGKVLLLYFQKGNHKIMVFYLSKTVLKEGKWIVWLRR